MNTSESIKYECDFITDVTNSEYEFNRFEKGHLKTNVSVLKMMVVTRPYSNWVNAKKIIWAAMIEKFPLESFNIFCFISSPYWKKEKRLTRHYGLGKFLSKEFEIEPLMFEFEKEIICENDIIFYGVVKLTNDNAREIFNLLSNCENGVMFTWRNKVDESFNELVDQISSLIRNKTKSLTCNLDVVKAINLILDKGCTALFPYAWEEVGEYHLDIFEGQGKDGRGSS